MGDHSHLTFRNPAGGHIREVASSGTDRMDIRSTDKKFVSVTLRRNGKEKDWNLPAPIALNTEVGMVNRLAELVSGKRSDGKYASVTFDDVGPKMQTITLTRLTATTVREDVDGSSNELTVDAQGYVTRQVSADSNSTSSRIAVFKP